MGYCTLHSKLVALCLVTALASSAQAADQQQLTLELADSVPVHSQQNRISQQDLTILVTTNNQGALHERGWARLAGVGPFFAPVNIQQQHWDGNQLNLEAVVDLPHLWPQRTGGQITVNVQATRQGRRLTGAYQLRSDGLSARELSDLVREKLRTTSIPRRFASQLASASLSSQIPPSPSVQALEDFPHSLEDYIIFRGAIGRPTLLPIPTDLAPGQLLPAAVTDLDQQTMTDLATGQGERLLAAAISDVAVADLTALITDAIQETEQAWRDNEWFLYAKNISMLAMTADALSGRGATVPAELTQLFKSIGDRHQWA